MGYYMYETIQCPFCGEHHAHITYEENRIYQLNCTECHNAIFHQDSSWDNAVKFFKGLFIVEDKLVDKFNSIGCTSFSLKYNPDVREIFKEDALNDRIEKIECSIEDFKRLGYTDEEAEELYKHINIYI